MIGLGASAINDAKYAYAQNPKVVEHYADMISQDRLAVFKGHVQTENDLRIKNIILETACHGKVRITDIDHNTVVQNSLGEMVNKGILRKTAEGLQFTAHGRAFIRNICSVFDEKIRSGTTSHTSQAFSKSI